MTDPSSPMLSIVIPTLNRKDLLGEALDSLNRLSQAPGEIEVIVVDDGSTDGTLKILSGRRDRFFLRVIQHEHPQGPAAARNRGAREARGEILGFIDSDVVVGPGWWLAVRPHFADPAVAGVEGATLATPAYYPPTPFSHWVSNPQGGKFLTCNICYRKKIFWEAGGFDPRFFPYAHREDTDLAFSILERGHEIVFEPWAVVEHPLKESTPWMHIERTHFGVHEALLRRKHPRLYYRRLKWIDGWAFPIFFYGAFLGIPLLLSGGLAGSGRAAVLGAGLFGFGWLGWLYAACRKRKTRWVQLLQLLPQYALIPWLQLYQVLRGEWKYRREKSAEPGRR